LELRAEKAPKQTLKQQQPRQLTEPKVQGGGKRGLAAKERERAKRTHRTSST